MNNTTTNAWKRVVAFILTLVMVFGMLPTNVAFAEELPEQSTDATSGTEGSTDEASGEEAPTAVVLLGTVEPITPGGALKADGNGVSYSNLSLEWVEKNAAVGRNEDGWWVGIKVNAPSTMLTEQDFANVTYNYNGGETKSFWDKQDSDKTAESTQRYITLWGLVNENWAASFAKDGKTLNYIWNFDWNGDAVTDQTVTLTVDPATVTLMKGEVQMFPAPYGEGKVTAITAGASVADNVVTYANPTLNWVAADSSVERNQNGWWVGIKVEAPAGISAAELENAKYMSGTQEKSFWTNRDSADEEPHYITLWGLVNEEYLLMALNKEGEKVLNYNWNFDWNNDGYYEQNVRIVVYAENVVLVKNGAQVYPYTVAFAHGNGVIFTDLDGNQLDSVTVMPTESVSFKYTFADEDKGYEVTIKDGETVLTAVEGVYTISGVTASRTITAEVRDNTVPTITEATVSNADVWTTKKTITVQAEDNSGAVTTYISTVSYDNNQVADLMANETAASSCEVTTHIGAGESVTYYVYAVDASGNMAKTSVDVKMIDREAPEITSHKIESDWYCETHYITVEDLDSGIASVTVSSIWGNETLTADKNGQYHFDAYYIGTYTITVTDNVGNTFTSEVDALNLDTKDPTVTLPGDICTNKEQFHITASFSDAQEKGNGGGVVKLHYYYTTKDSKNNVETSETKTVEIEKNATSYDIPGPEKDGEYTYYVQVEDSAGKFSDFATVNVVKDTKKPEIISSVYTERPNEKFFNGWQHVLKYPDTVSITVDAEDELSGVASYWYRLYPTHGDPGEWTEVTAETFTVTKAEFTGRIEVYAMDKAGNKSKGFFTYYKYPGSDTEHLYVYLSSKNAVKPSVEVTLKTEDGAVYDGSWTNQTVTVELNSYVSNGVAYYQYSTDGGFTWTDLTITSSDANSNLITHTISENTNAAYIFRAVSNDVDADGNNYVGENNGDYWVKVHKTAPDMAKVTITGEKTSEDNAWYIEVPSVVITEPVSAYPGDLIIYTEFRIYVEGSEDKGEWIDVSDFGKLSERLENLNNGSVDGKFVIEVKTRDIADNETVAFSHVTGAADAPVETTVSSQPIWVDTNELSNLTITATYDKYLVDENGEYVRDENGKPVKDESVEEPVTEDIVNKNVKDVNGVSTEDFYFTNFYPHAITITMNVGEVNVSGLQKLEYQLVESIPAVIDDTAWVEYTGAVTVEPNQMFYVIFRATDNAGRTEIVKSTGIVVDDQKPAGSYNGNIELDWKESKADATYKDESFYTKNFTVDITVVDPLFEDGVYNENGDYSGLKSVTYTIYTVEEDGSQVSSEPVGVDLTAKDGSVVFGTEGLTKNLVKSVTHQINVDAEKFESNFVYIQVVAVDNANNIKTTTVGPFKVDMFNPVVRVSYEDSVAPENGSYYKAGRTAVITVNELNFDPALLDITLTRDGANVEIDKNIDNWIEGEAVGNQKDKTWTLRIPCTLDGDYVLTINDLRDKANRSYEKADSSLPIVNDTFTIDTVDPEITVTYDNNNVTNGKYFDAARTVTVTVEEHNFDPERTTVTINATLDGQPVQVPEYQFTHNGDYHTAIIILDDDGDYTFTASATDLAGNSNQGIHYGASEAPTDFTIDTTIEQPTVGGVENGGAYKDEVAPSVDIYDVNYESYTLTLTRTNGTIKDEDVTEQFFELIEFDAPGGILHTEDIPHVEENDGIYTLTVVIYDMAGNSTTTTTIFTVNRFGSVYKFGEYLAGLAEGEGAYVTEVTEDLTLTEYNPDQLEEGSVQIEITRDGKPLDIDEDDFTVTPTPNDLVGYGESGWYEYDYTINMENFTEDGVYKITILTKDKTGNECQSDTITFRVDKAAPELSSVVGLEESIINAQEVDVRYTVFDAIGLESVTIYVNGEVYEVITDFGDDFNNYTGTFKLTESNDVQSVQIVIKDLAGNILDTDAEGFTSAYEFNSRVTVSTNWFVRWFANKPLFFGSLAGIGGGLWLLWFLIFGKRKKEEEEEQTV